MADRSIRAGYLSECEYGRSDYHPRKKQSLRLYPYLQALAAECSGKTALSGL
jgi:hypothetical protein